MKHIGIRLGALFLLLAGGLLGYFLYTTQDSKPFSLGLDLSGGTHLGYVLDMTGVPDNEKSERSEALRDVIERRVNLFGVAEPNVHTETARIGQDEKQYRLAVELPGITNIDDAIAMIGETPLLEFKEQNPDISIDSVTTENLPENMFITTELTGAHLKRARLEFSQSGAGQVQGGQPHIALEFTAEGADLFADITGRNVGNVVAIYLDGSPISTPVVQQKITGGEAVITGDFTIDEAKTLVGRLNSGALPVPISLISSEAIGPSLGAQATSAGVVAGIVGFIAVGIFLILYYRLPGILAVLALGMYGVIMLALFKIIPVTLTAPGIAGFVISLGMAVDANILIFERAKEEILSGKSIAEALRTGFDRAWLSIRDGNISSIISGIILFWFGTSLIKGFALVFMLGVFVSMITAITMSRVLLYACAPERISRWSRFLFLSGLHK